MTDKEKKIEREKEIIALTKEFCDKYINEEYSELCEALVKKLGRKRSVPFMTGNLNIWAAAVVHTIGGINFLYDKSFEPYIKLPTIYEHFDVKSSTITAKTKQIKDLLKIGMFDSEFSTKKMNDNNPYNNLVMVDGLIVPLSTLPENLQEEVRKVRAEGGDISFSTK